MNVIKERLLLLLGASLLSSSYIPSKVSIFFITILTVQKNKKQDQEEGKALEANREIILNMLSLTSLFFNSVFLD